MNYLVLGKNKGNNWILTGFLSLVFILFLALFCFFPPLIVLIVFLGFILLFALAIKPEIGLYLMILFLPVINLNFNFYNLVIPLIDLITIAVLAAYFLRVFYYFFTHSQL